MNLVDRSKKIILTPQAEWEVINLEATSTAQLYTQYIMLLAAIGPVAMFLGSTVFGYGIPFFGGFHFSLMAGLSQAIVSYVFALVGVFLVALLIDALAPSFGGQKNQLQAFKVAAYSFTPSWLAGVFHLLPVLAILALVASLYSLYLLYLGLPVLMKTTKEKAVGYTAVVVVCAFVIFAVFGSIAGLVSGMAMWSRHSNVSFTDSNGTTTVNVEGLKQMGASIDAANKQMEAAKQTGNPQAQADAAGAAMSAMMGGNGKAVEPVDQNLLKALLPDAVANLKRNRLEAEKAGMGNIKVSKADAGYSDDQGHSVDVTITDAGGTPMFGGLAAWAMVEQERETDDGYEKTGKVDGRSVHEKFNKKSKDGEYSVVIANRFIIDAHGRQVDMDTLKQVIAAIGPDKLEAMKNVGVKQ